MHIEEIQSKRDKSIEEEIFDMTPLPSILNVKEIAQIKILLDMDSTLMVDEYLNDESLEIHKIDVVTEQLIAEMEETRIEPAIHVAMKSLSKKKLKKLKEGKEIKIRIQLKDND